MTVPEAAEGEVTRVLTEMVALMTVSVSWGPITNPHTWGGLKQ